MASPSAIRLAEQVVEAHRRRLRTAASYDKDAIRRQVRAAETRLRELRAR